MNIRNRVTKLEKQAGNLSDMPITFLTIYEDKSGSLERSSASATIIWGTGKAITATREMEETHDAFKARIGRLAEMGDK